MSAVAEETSSVKLYRCGFCSHDFLSLEACLTHLTSHTSEQEKSSQTLVSAAAFNSQQQTHDVGKDSSVTGHCSTTPPPHSETSGTTSQSGLPSSVIPSILNNCDPSLLLLPAEPDSNHAMNIERVGETVAATSHHSDVVVQTSEQKDTLVQSSKPNSILVKTHSSGAFIVNTESRSANVDGVSKAGKNNSNSLVKAKKQHWKQNHAEFRDVCVEQVDSHGCGDALQGQKSSSYEGRSVTVRHSNVNSTSQVSKDDDRPYACTECPARYRFLSSLSVHKKRHSGSEPYQCKTCKKKFWHPTNLRVHERVHAKERLFNCKVCGHGFNQANDLRIHMRIHTGEMPLRCPVDDCSRAFRDPACLRRHMNKHRGVEPHIACDQCSARFFHPSGLARHYKRHTGQKDHVCHLCNSAFARGDTLKLHMRIHSGQKPYFCSVCKRGFADRSYCRRHVSKHDASLKARIVSTLQGKYMVKKEKEEEQVKGAEDNIMEAAQDISEGQPQAVQKQKPGVVVPVEIHVPDSNEADIPYASIEIEIPESDLMNGDGSGEMVYQYGDMLITISRSAVGLADVSTPKTDGVSQQLENVVIGSDSSATTDPKTIDLQQTEHQYSRAAARAEVNDESGEMPASDRPSQVTSLNSLVVKADMAVPQPLSEYNEIVTSIVEPELAQSKQLQFRTIPGPREKQQRNPRVGEKRWPCPDCHAAFFHQAELKRHQTKHTGELPYQCTICGKKVRDPSNLKRHVRTHTGERPYSCQICGKTFRQAGHLSAHVRIHTGQRPYRCNICPATFIEANHLRYHQKVHAGIKPFQCPDCGLSFIRNAELKRHSHVHTQRDEGNLKCPLCPAKFFRSDALRQHVRKKHEQNLPYRCDVCSQTFSRQSVLDWHCVKMKHDSRCRPEMSVKVSEPKSDVENTVVADALCELATGRRTAALSGEEAGRCVVSSSAGSSDPTNSLVTNVQSSIVIVAREGVEVQTRVMPSKRVKNKGIVEELDATTTGSNSGTEHFVQRVLVDGGSVSGARVVLVDSEGMENLQVVDNEQDNTQGLGALHSGYSEPQRSITCPLPTVDEETIDLNSGKGGCLNMDVASASKPASPKVVDVENTIEIDGSSSVINSSADQTGGHVVSHHGDSELNDQLASDSLHTVIIDGMSSGVLNSDSATVFDPTNPVLLVKTETAGQAGDQRTQLQSLPEPFLSPPTAESALASTIQSIVSGAVKLETVSSLEVGSVTAPRGLQGKGMGEGVIVKQEPGQTASQPFVAPLRTRSGRERKVRVKMSL